MFQPLIFRGFLGLEPTNHPIAISALHLMPRVTGSAGARSQSLAKKSIEATDIFGSRLFLLKDSKPKRSMYSIPIVGCPWYLSKWIMNDYDILYCNSFSNYIGC